MYLIFIIILISIRFDSGLGNLGSGSGKGGGSGGTIREAGGALGEREAAREEEYFYKKVYINLSTLCRH